MSAGRSGEAPPLPAQAPTRTADDWLQRLTAGATLAGRYRILGLVGLGGMGLVYRAHDEKLGLDVAVKVLRPDVAGDEGRLARFRQELLLARQVSHPHVVRTHDVGEDGDLTFLTMDFVPGRSLRQLLAEEGRLAPERAVDLARQIASALGAAHEAGVVHRDLKPANILIDPAGRAAITDFGVARSLAGSALTQPGAVIGTLDYLAPEQARGEAVDGRADLYALGLVIHEMLAGSVPLAEGSTVERIAQRRSGVARSLRSAGVSLPPRYADLERIERRLLQSDRARRYPTAREALADLERLGRAAPRRRWKAWLAVGGALALLAAGWGFRARLRPLFVRAPSRGVAPPAAHALALLPLVDETGRPDLAWLASGLPDLLGGALGEGPGLRVLEGDRVAQTLESLKLAPGALGSADARRLGELLDADRLVGGRVYRLGERIGVDLSLTATGAGPPSTRRFHAEAEPAEAYRLVDRLATALRQGLAPSDRSSAPEASRSSAALAAYAAGTASLRRGDALAAAGALERAVAIDPRYGSAWVALARSREALGRSGAARDAARRAVEVLGTGESRGGYEARALEARLAGNAGKAQEILRGLVERHPEDADARMDLAQAYGEQGSLDRAIETLGGVVKVAPHHPRAWFLLGKYSIVAGNARRAVDDYLVHALVVQNQLGSEEGRADVLNAFGVGYRNLGDRERAAENYRQAAEIRRRIGDERGYATTLRNLATLAVVGGDYGGAERQLKEALAILRRLGDEPGIADLLNEFGVLAEERGDFEGALARYQEALRARRDLGNDQALAESFGNVGYACYQLGRYDDALVYWQQGMGMARKSGDPGGVVLATQNLGLLQVARGQWDEAVKSFVSALRGGRELGLQEAIAASLGHLGKLAQYQGRPAAALASFREALAVLRALEDRRGLTEFTLASAEIEVELGDEAGADKLLRETEALLEKGRNREQQAELNRLRGEWLLLRGDRMGARAAMRRSVADAEASHGVVALLDARISAAGVELPAGSAAPGVAVAARLAAQAEALGHARLRLRAAELLGRATLAAGDATRAEAVLRGALALAAGCGGSSSAYRLHRLLARALTREGKGEAAQAELRRAEEEIARLRRDLAPEERSHLDRLAARQDLAR